MRPVAKSFETKTEAARFSRLLESEIDRGVFVDRTEAQRSTLGELIDRYLAEVTPLKKFAREAKLFAACDKSRATMLAPVVRFAIETGMRMGEILSLQWRYVYMVQRVATLPAAVRNSTYLSQGKRGACRKFDSLY